MRHSDYERERDKLARREIPLRSIEDWYEEADRKAGESQLRRHGVAERAADRPFQWGGWLIVGLCCLVLLGILIATILNHF